MNDIYFGKVEKVRRSEMIRISENSLDRERAILGDGPDFEGRGNGAEVGTGLT